MRTLESKYPILILSYQNCEIYCCHLDGYKENTEALLNRLNKIEAEFSGKPVHATYRIWYNLDENKLDKPIMKSIVESICRIQSHVYKIGFVGLHGIYRWRFDDMLKQILGKKAMCRAYFSDAEQAKEWLV